ncbi:MAG TPA: DUF58 domain-containing protein [Spirochaetia bacterium]|nr:DUF58 domain-containing protein [Spirochaetia bacterium]HRZ65428.1 DUF58 domain-containing protein [Spirochaetia bacterium]
MSDSGRGFPRLVPIPERRLIYAAAAALALSVLGLLWAPSRAVAFAADAILVGAAALETGLFLSRPRPRFAAKETALLVEGVEEDLLVRVENEGDESLEIEADLDLDFRLRGGKSRRVLAPAGGIAELALPILPERRGPARVESLRWSAPGKLGFLRFAGTGVLGLGIFVRPAAPRKAVTAAVARVSKSQGDSPAASLGQGSDFYSLRDYARGEDSGSIDWKASTRVGRPVSRLRVEEGSASIALAIDCGRLMRAEKGGRSAMDEAADALLVLAQAALRRGDSIRALAFSDKVLAELPELRGPSSLRRAAAFAARLDAAIVDPDYAAAAARLRRTLTKRSLVVFLTEVSETAPLANLEEAVSSLSGRHATTVVFLSDAGLEAAATGASSCESEAATYRTAAAVELIAGREAARSRLQRRGARVVVARPGLLSGRLVEAYFAAKRERRV